MKYMLVVVHNIPTYKEIFHDWGKPLSPGDIVRNHKLSFITFEFGTGPIQGNVAAVRIDSCAHRGAASGESRTFTITRDISRLTDWPVQRGPVGEYKAYLQCKQFQDIFAPNYFL